MSARLKAATFQTPLAVALDLSADSNQEFDLVLDTADSGGAHQVYRLKFVSGQVPEIDFSTDTTTFTLGGTGTPPNVAWNDGNKHTWVLVLDGTRLLFWLDRQPLLELQAPVLPKPMASLMLVSMNQATITGIRIYPVL